MLKESEFENIYNREITLLKILEVVSFDSSLMNLYGEYKRLDGDEVKFDALLKDWELKRS